LKDNEEPRSPVNWVRRSSGSETTLAWYNPLLIKKEIHGNLLMETRKEARHDGMEFGRTLLSVTQQNHNINTIKSSSFQRTKA
jgi:hypothetical protein